MAAEVAAATLPLAAVGWGVATLLEPPLPWLLVLLAAWGLQGILLVRGADTRSDRSGLGPADRITLARSTLVLPLLALSVAPGTAAALGAWPAGWLLVALATVALALDGLDGLVARGSGTSSAFGARYDMELDNVLLVALSLLLWQAGKAGAWVLAIGALRYVWVAAATLLPPLGGELPPSFRRKAVCVVQGVVLTVGLAPVVGPVTASASAAAALAALAGSFAVDAVALLGPDSTGPTARRR